LLEQAKWLPETNVSGGKSEHHRAGWSLTATGGDPRESATENIPPPTALLSLLGVRVKWRGKSSPVPVVTSGAWQTPPGARPNREAFEGCPADASG